MIPFACWQPRRSPTCSEPRTDAAGRGERGRNAAPERRFRPVPCPAHVGAGAVQRAQALGLVRCEQCQVAVVEAARGHARRCAPPAAHGSQHAAARLALMRSSGSAGASLPSPRASPVPACLCLPVPACLPAVEAMRLYVRTLEEEVPDWWAQHQASGVGAPTANGTAEGAPAAAACR